jgi:hypothetical protein
MRCEAFMRRSMMCACAAVAMCATSAARGEGPTVSAHDANDTIVVHVESPTSVLVQRHDGATWEDVCRSPCDQALPRDAEYRVVSSRGRPSATFRLRGGTDDRVVLRVDPYGVDRQVVGGIFAVAGGISIAAGLLAFAVAVGGGDSNGWSLYPTSCAEAGDNAAVAACEQQRHAADARSAGQATTTGAIFVVIGVLSLVGGLALGSGDATTVEQTTRAPLPSPRAPERLPGSGFSATKPTFAAPVVTLTF